MLVPRVTKIPLVGIGLLLAACSGGGGSSQAPPSTDGPSTTPPAGPGTFSSVWQATSMEVTVYDEAAPMAPVQRTIPVPAVTEAAGKRVTLYLTFEGDKRITYAHYENTKAYYRIAQPAYHYGDGDIAQYTTKSGLYMLEEGVLKLTTSREADGKSIISTTTFRPVAFPPAGWPAEKIDHEAEEEYP